MFQKVVNKKIYTHFLYHSDNDPPHLFYCHKMSKIAIFNIKIKLSSEVY